MAAYFAGYRTDPEPGRGREEKPNAPERRQHEREHCAVPKA